MRFELELGPGGVARVMREDGSSRYAMRIEQIADEARYELLRLATSG